MHIRYGHVLIISVGLTLAAQINARLLDRVYQYYKRKNGGVGRPEFRLVNVIPGTFLLPIGLFLAGWGAQERLFWLVPDIVSCSSIVGPFTLQNNYRVSATLGLCVHRCRNYPYFPRNADIHH